MPSAEDFKNKGNDAFKAGKHAEAIEFYTYATEMDPNNPIFYTNRSFAYFKIGESKKKANDAEDAENNFKKSLRDAQKATSKDPKWAKGHYRAAKALQALGQHKEALAAVKEAAKVEPSKYNQEVAAIEAVFHAECSTAEIEKEKGNSAFKSGQIDNAKKHYSAAIHACKADENDMKADCYANRAACNRQLYLPEETINDADEALKLNPDHVKALIRRGQAHESMEKYKKAFADFDKARQLSPSTKVAIDGVNRIRTAMKKLGMM